MEYYTAERKKELLLFTTAWMELESISLICGIKWRNLTKKQKRDRIIESRLTVLGRGCTAVWRDQTNKKRTHRPGEQGSDCGGEWEGRWKRVRGEMVMEKIQWMNEWMTVFTKLSHPNFKILEILPVLMEAQVNMAHLLMKPHQITTKL